MRICVIETMSANNKPDLRPEVRVIAWLLMKSRHELYTSISRSSNWNVYIFIVIALDETSIVVAVQFSLQNIYESLDLGRALWWSNIDVHQ